MAHDVFISYANEDKAVAYAVCAHLEERGIRCWIAPRDVTAGVYYAQAIIKAIKESRVMALVFSSNANKSEHVVREAEQAVRAGIPIIPFRIDTSSPAEMLNYYIGPQHWLDAATPPIEEHVQRLGDAIELRLEAPAEAPDEALNPEPSGARVLGTPTTLDGGLRPGASEELGKEIKPRTRTGPVWLRRPRSRVFTGALAAAVVIVLMIAGFAFFNPLKPSPESSESPNVLGTGTLELTLSEYVSPNSTLTRGDTITIQLYPSGTYQSKDKMGTTEGQYLYYPPFQPKAQNTYRLFFAEPHGTLVEMQPKGGFSWYSLKNENEPLYIGQYNWTTPFKQV
jgi:TIR domain